MNVRKLTAEQAARAMVAIAWEDGDVPDVDRIAGYAGVARDVVEGWVRAGRVVVSGGRLGSAGREVTSTARRPLSMEQRVAICVRLLRGGIERGRVDVTQVARWSRLPPEHVHARLLELRAAS